MVKVPSQTPIRPFSQDRCEILNNHILMELLPCVECVLAGVFFFFNFRGISNTVSREKNAVYFSLENLENNLLLVGWQSVFILSFITDIATRIYSLAESLNSVFSLTTNTSSKTGFRRSCIFVNVYQLFQLLANTVYFLKQLCTDMT